MFATFADLAKLTINVLCNLIFYNIFCSYERILLEVLKMLVNGTPIVVAILT